jgi:acyl carrier protein
MDKQLLFFDLSKLLEMPISELSEETNLQKNTYWDSLAMISLIGAIDEHYKVSISGEELTQAILVKDVYKIIETKIQEVNAKP